MYILPVASGLLFLLAFRYIQRCYTDRHHYNTAVEARLAALTAEFQRK